MRKMTEQQPEDTWHTQAKLKHQRNTRWLTLTTRKKKDLGISIFSVSIWFYNNKKYGKLQYMPDNAALIDLGDSKNKKFGIQNKKWRFTPYPSLLSSIPFPRYPNVVWLWRIQNNWLNFTNIFSVYNHIILF